MKHQFKRGLIPLFFMLFLHSFLYAQKVQLIWTASADTAISHYGIYRSNHIDSTFTLIGTVNHPDTIYYDETIQIGTYYYYAATAIDIFSNESGFSNIVEIETTPTPVELSAFTARIDDNDVILEWGTASESNNYGFEIQRSKNDHQAFNKIGFVNGNGTTSNPHFYRYVDENLENGTYYYRLKQIDFTGEYEYSHTIEVSVGLPTEFRLYQNNPNPFNSSTLISYNLPKNGHVELTIHNITGQLVYKLVDEIQQAGHHTVHWDGINFEGKNVSSGLYVYRIKSLGRVEFRRMLYLR